MTYKQATNNDYIIRTSDGAWIPPDTRNADYREFQAWLAQGNVPYPADPLPPPPPKRFDLSQLTIEEIAALKELLKTSGVIMRKLGRSAKSSGCKKSMT